MNLFTKFAGYYTKALNSQQKLGLQTQILTVLPTLLTALATASILVIGGFRVINGSLSIGMLVAYQLLATSFLKPVNNLINFGSTLQELEADLNRLDDVLQNPVDQSNIVRSRETETESRDNGNGSSPHQSLNSVNSVQTNSYRSENKSESSNGHRVRGFLRKNIPVSLPASQPTPNPTHPRPTHP